MKTCNRCLIVIGFFTAFLALGCSDKPVKSAEDQVVIRIDERVVTLREFDDYFEAIKVSLDEDVQNSIALREARLMTLLQLVEEVIILKRADELGLDISPEELDKSVGDFKKGLEGSGFEDQFLKEAISFEAWKERLRKRLLVKKVIDQELLKDVSITPQEIKGYYDKHREEWSGGEEARVFQILLPSEDIANKVMDRIKGGEEFSALARLHSTAPEADAGGDMGYVVRGQLPEALEKAIFGLEPGDVSPVVKTPYGFHIFQVTERRITGVPRIEDSIERIKQGILKEMLATSYGPWLASLRSRYKIDINKEIV